MQTRLHRFSITLAGLWLLCSGLPAALAAGNTFGNKDPGLYNLKGQLYFLPTGTEGMPDNLERRKPDGVIYTEKLDIPSREFTEGFPGVSQRFEWFGLIYSGQFQVEKGGRWGWRLQSDDGSRLWIDGKEVIDLDGVHGFDSADGHIMLTPGIHSIKVWYYQGPATELGLQLFVTPPGQAERIFNLAEFSGSLRQAASEVKAQPTKDGIRVNFDAAVLFDTGKAELKPSAAPTLRSAVGLIAAYPKATVKVYGHTDAIGDDTANQKLSEARATAVRNALMAAGAPSGVRFEVKGFGETQPVASNDNEAGRQKNRRVELYIQP